MTFHSKTLTLESFKGDWGLITGASSGIGLEYAGRAAAAGLNLVLVARRKEPLDKLARELEKTHKIQTRVFSSDLAQRGESIRIAEQLKSEKIRIRFLCHAAGFGSWGSFTEEDSKLLTRLVNLNTNSLIELLMQFHDDLASHATSAVVIVSSRAGLHPMPTMAVYAAAKSFAQSLAQALNVEWENEGIYVQALMPGAVDTALQTNQILLAKGILRKEEMEPPKEVVDASLRGFVQKKPRVMTGKGTAMQRFFSTVLPTRLYLRLVKNRYSARTDVKVNIQKRLNVSDDIKPAPTIERLVPDTFLESPYASQREIAEQHFRRYKKACEYAQGCRILDIACGVGYGSRMLRDAGATEVVAVDLSPTAIAYAKKRYGAPGIEFICANAEEFKLPGMFDVISTMETVEHLQNPLAFLQKLRRALREGGQLILSVPLGETSHYDPYHLHDFDEAALTHLLQTSGFSTDVQYRDYETVFMPRSQILAMSRDRNMDPVSKVSLKELLFSNRGWKIIRDFVIQGGYKYKQVMLITTAR